MQSITIGKNEAGQRFDKFLVKYLPGAPKSIIYKMLRKKNITLNKKKADGTEKLEIGDTVESFFSDETFNKFTQGSATLQSESKTSLKSESTKLSINPEIVYEDDNIMIVNKPAGVLSQKAEPKDYSLNEWLIDYMLQNGEIDDLQLRTFRPSVCNRLDRNTSGLVVCGKSLHGLQEMTKIIREKSLQKYYLTICHGIIDKDFRAEGIISKDKGKNKSSVNNNVKDDEVNIITDFKILEKLDNATVLEVRLHTGKSHQIRAQLSSLNHPIYGDKKYGEKRFDDPAEKKLKYQLLTAYKLIFPSKEELPDDMEALGDKVITIKPPVNFEKTKAILCLHGNQEV